ncbi:hypothetical protein [Thermocatellispora tengchongensis]|uniref:hypothetical protein n=1 Tax=Thermocatellispora tengchongensis TaxID=1073253 RepID=UPI0036360B3E
MAVAAVVAVAGVLAAATPQGRAVVARVLRVAGVEIQVTPSPSPVPTASVRLPGERAVSLAEARELAAFPVAVPRELGEPAEVRIADGARVVSLIWPGVRLDQYDGALGVVFRKELGPPWPEEVDVAGVPGWWIPRHHGLRYVPRGGGAPVEDTRLAGPTLIWQHGGAGLRLEGIAGLSRALAVARSLG